MSQEEVDKPLSEIEETHREFFFETAEEVETTTEGFQKILKVIEQVKQEEITVYEAQQEIDTIVEEYDLPAYS